MKKLLLLFSLIVIATVSFAQSKTISGVVADANGKPLPFVSVAIKGTKNGVTGDADGKFSIKNVPSNAILVISSVGYENSEISIGNSNTVSVTLRSTSASNLSEVVVTSAFGIKKSQRTTPYSAQNIKSDALNLIPQTNVVDALAGKIAGVQTRSQSNAKLNQSDALRIRGGLSLGDVAPIFIVDGTIINSFDINPDDVDDLTVLKGANATALFGERAKGGAVVINTKKKGSRQGIGVDITQSVMMDKVYILPEYQNQYAGGASADLMQYHWASGQPAEWKALDGKYFPDYTDDASWGPRMTGQEYVPWYAWFPGTKYSFKTAPLVAQPNNARDFWNTGITSTTNASFSSSSTVYSMRMSYTNQNITGIIPNSQSIRHNLFFSGSLDLNKHFTVGVNGTYSTNRIKGEFNDGYANQSSGSFTQWFHRHNDMKIMKELSGTKSPVGALLSWNLLNNPDAASGYEDIIGNYWYNYFDYFKNLDLRQGRDRFFGDFSIKYTLNNHFNVRAAVRKNQLTTYAENSVGSILQRSGGQTGVLAFYGSNNTSYNEYNFEGLANYNNTFLGKLAVNATIGGNVLRTQYKENGANTNQGLSIPDLYSLANSKAQPTIVNRREASRVNSVFATGDVEWNKFTSITFAVRNDWYSTLPIKENHLLSPSVGASFVFSEFTKSALPWLTFGKVFGSWGKKPTSIDIYRNNFGYAPAQFLWDGNFVMGTPNAVVSEDLKGSLVSTYEAGIDLRFLKGRAGLNVLYYSEDNDGEPIAVPVNAVSGFNTLVVNAVRVKRQGIEVMINASPIKGKNFSWDITKTFGYLIKNPVVNIYQGINSVLLAGGAFGTRFARAFQEINSDWGQLIGGGIKRNAAGLKVVNAQGLYIVDANKHWGSVVPKTTGGLINNFTYKDFFMNVSLDYQIGGKFFSLSESWGQFSGLLDETAETNDKGKNVRDAVTAGGGVHVVGVSSIDEKTPVDMYVEAQTYFHQFYGRRIAEPFVHDLTFVKIREASLGYRIPVKKIGNVSKYIQAATFSVIARNPWIIYREAKNFDPSEIVAVQGEDGQLPGTRSFGAVLKLTF